jgi:hypothetical protein
MKAAIMIVMEAGKDWVSVSSPVVTTRFRPSVSH